MTDDTPRNPLGMEDAEDIRADDAATYTTEDDDGDQQDDTPTTRGRHDGIELRVTMVDWGRRDADGTPHTISSREMFSLYELARMDNMDYAERALRVASRKVIGEFRSVANVDAADEDEDGDA